MNLWPFSKKSTTAFSSAHLAHLLASVFGGGATKSGASVNSTTALQVSTVLACARVIAEGCAQVPWKVMKESQDGKSRLPAKQHQLWDLLHRKPNRWQTSFAFRETMLLHVLVGPTGSAYAFKNRVGSDRRLRELVLIDPHRVREDVAADGSITYNVTGKDGGLRQFVEADIWHIRGPSWNGQTALSLIQLAREAIGLAMATEETQAKLHKNGVRTTGTYAVDGQLNKSQHTDLAAWIKQQAADGFMILDRGAKWQPHSMTGVDAQHLETRLFQVKEVCRAMRVMPIMVMESDKASTYASAEQMFIAHLVHTLLPWYERIEQSADVFLLTDEERSQGYYTLLEPAGMLRGSLKDTADYISRLTERGVLTRNEGRELLDRNPIDGLDEPLTPANMLTGATNEPAPAGA